MPDVFRILRDNHVRFLEHYLLGRLPNRPVVEKLEQVTSIASISLWRVITVGETLPDSIFDTSSLTLRI